MDAGLSIHFYFVGSAGEQYRQEIRNRREKCHAQKSLSLRLRDPDQYSTNFIGYLCMIPTWNETYPVLRLGLP